MAAIALVTAPVSPPSPSPSPPLSPASSSAPLPESILRRLETIAGHLRRGLERPGGDPRHLLDMEMSLVAAAEALLVAAHDGSLDEALARACGRGAYELILEYEISRARPGELERALMTREIDAQAEPARSRLLALLAQYDAGLI